MMFKPNTAHHTYFNLEFEKLYKSYKFPHQNDTSEWNWKLRTTLWQLPWVSNGHLGISLFFRQRCCASTQFCNIQRKTPPIHFNLELHVKVMSKCSYSSPMQHITNHASQPIPSISHSNRALVATHCTFSEISKIVLLFTVCSAVTVAWVRFSIFRKAKHLYFQNCNWIFWISQV